MISLLIPTMNRSEFVIRLLKYYANACFKGNILIGDSSNPAQFEKAGEGVRALKGQLKIEHYSYPGMNNYAVTQQLIAKVTTPYATFLPDDDFYVPSAIEKCIAFLNAHPDYCCAWGKSILFTLQSSGAFGSFKALSPSNEAMRFSLEEEKGHQRLYGHIKHYTSVFIGVCKTPVLKKALRHASDLNNSAKTKDVKWWTAEEFGELATSLSMVVQGKIKSIDCLYWIRQGHDQRYLFPDSFDWVTSPNWFDCHQILSRQIIEDIVMQDGIDPKEAEKIWKDLFWGYLCHAFQSGFQASQKKVGAEDKMKASLQRIPGLYKILKQMRDQLRKTKSKIGNSDDFSLAGLLDPSSRCHEDFMPVYRLVTSS